MGSKSDIFIFRAMSFSDLNFFNSVRNTAAPFLHDQRLFSLEETAQWFRNGPPSDYWIVEHEKNDIGYFRCLALDAQTAMIGADIHPDFQGKGLAKSMYREFARSVLIPNQYTRCTLRVLKSNKRAQSLYLNLGFIKTSETLTDVSMLANVGALAKVDK
jgi:RimJ/RimL family protein N-acetyltransferase